MDNRTRKRLNNFITKEIENKYLVYFEKMTAYVGNGIYTINNIYSADTRELFLMYCAKQEGFNYESESPKPEMLPDDQIDLEEIKVNLQSCIDEIWNDDYHEDNNNATYAYETAMQVFFGEDIWDKINKQIS